MTRLIYKDVVWTQHCVEIEGQIVSIFGWTRGSLILDSTGYSFGLSLAKTHSAQFNVYGFYTFLLLPLVVVKYIEDICFFLGEYQIYFIE